MPEIEQLEKKGDYDICLITLDNGQRYTIATRKDFPERAGIRAVYDA
jgi:hypothetical protein